MTKRLVALAFVFAVAACVPLLVADTIWGVGITTTSVAIRLANLHWLFHVGTITLTTLGAFIAFQTLGGRGAPAGIVAILGFLFGLVSIVAAPAALVFADAHGVAFWQFLGGMFAAACASPFVKQLDATAADARR